MVAIAIIAIASGSSRNAPIGDREREPESSDSRSLAGLATRAHADAIKNGMTYDQVCQLMGIVAKSSSSQMGTSGEEYFTYVWDAVGRPGAQLHVTILNGKVITVFRLGIE